MVFFRSLAEFLLVSRRLHKQVESALRPDALKTKAFQPLVEQISVPVVGGHICLSVNAPFDHPLHERRRVHAAQHTVGNHRRIEHLLRLVHLVRNHQISDPLSRQRKGFAEGIADHRISIILCHKRNLYPVVSQLPVRLVGDQHNGMSYLG